jgi:hypothetical protein
MTNSETVKVGSIIITSSPFRFKDGGETKNVYVEEVLEDGVHIIGRQATKKGLPNKRMAQDSYFYHSDKNQWIVHKRPNED